MTIKIFVINSISFNTAAVPSEDLVLDYTYWKDETIEAYRNWYLTMAQTTRSTYQRAWSLSPGRCLSGRRQLDRLALWAR